MPVGIDSQPLPTKSISEATDEPTCELTGESISGSKIILPETETVDTTRSLINLLIERQSVTTESTGISKNNPNITTKLSNEKLRAAHFDGRLTTEDIEALINAPAEILQQCLSTTRLTDFGFHTINDPKNKLRIFHLEKIGEGGMSFVTKCFAYPVGSPKDSFIAVVNKAKYTNITGLIKQNDILVPNIHAVSQNHLNCAIDESRIQIAFGRAINRYQKDKRLNTEDMLNIGILPPIALDSTPRLEIQIYPLITPRKKAYSIDFCNAQQILPTDELLYCLKKYAETLHFLNSNMLTHPDLKEENLFYGNVNGKLYPLIGDLTPVDCFDANTEINYCFFAPPSQETIEMFSYDVNNYRIARTPDLAKYENKALTAISKFKAFQGRPPASIAGKITAQINLAPFSIILENSIKKHLNQNSPKMNSIPAGKKIHKLIQNYISLFIKECYVSLTELDNLANDAYWAYMTKKPYYYKDHNFSKLFTFADVAKSLGEVIEEIKAINSQEQ